MPDTFTATFNLVKPEVNSSRDTWGNKTNANWDTLDGVLKNLTDYKLPYVPKVAPALNEITMMVNFTHATAPQIKGKEIAIKEYVDAAIDAAVKARLPAGVISIWKGSVATIPAGWVLCDGQNGTPDLRDKFVLGASEQVMPGAVRTVVGQTGGTWTHDHGAKTGGTAITTAQMPAHNHVLNDPGHTHGVTDPGHIHTYNTATQSAGAGGPYGGFVSGWDGLNTSRAFTGISIQARVTGISMNNTGGGAAHDHPISLINHTPPYYALAFIMKT